MLPCYQRIFGSKVPPGQRCDVRFALKAWSFHNPRRRYRGSKGSTMGGTKKGMSVLDLFAGLGLCEGHIESKSGNNRLPSITIIQSGLYSRVTSTRVIAGKYFPNTSR